jgi:hypothetical protein
MMASLLPKMKRDKIKDKINKINRSIKEKFQKQIEQGSNNG